MDLHDNINLMPYKPMAEWLNTVIKSAVVQHDMSTQMRNRLAITSELRTNVNSSRPIATDL